jgi:transposase
MIEADKRKAIYLLHKEGMSVREISRRLKHSPNTVLKIICQKGEMPHSIRRDKIQIKQELLRQLYDECDGFVQRVHEKLLEEEGIHVKYSTLTRMMRELEISKAKKDRCGREPDKPGAEMQHDTSPYKMKLAGNSVKLIASLIYLRYSKRRYLKFYRAFNRFKMKCFFHEALSFWEYAAELCIIDNTNLARLRGTGKDAVIVKEMEVFAEQYGFKFLCHEKGHANRKAGEERSFYTVETNFFPGRTFQSLQDLNAQAFEWSTVRMENRPQGKTKLIPAKAFEFERSYLVKVLPHLPAPYLIHNRSTDQYGYVAFDGNYYFVPGTKRDDVRVLEYSEKLKIYPTSQRKDCIAEYPLPADGVKNALFSPEGFPKPRYQPKRRKKPTDQEEKRLRAMSESVNAYLNFALNPKGAKRHGFIRKLFVLSQKVTPELFQKTIERAHKYEITRIETIERIAVIYMRQGIEKLPFVEVDEAFRERDAYQQGFLTDQPDLSIYDDILEDDDG